MKLQINNIDIHNVKLEGKTRVADHLLNIDFQELRDIILKDKRIESVDIKLVVPGDRVRIVNVVDVIQPRCKLQDAGEDFPGWLGKLELVGQGVTTSLRGVSVILSNRYSNRPYSAIIDMFGKGGELSKFGKMNNICLAPKPFENTNEREFENAIKRAGLKTAVFLARCAKNSPIDETEIYELDFRQKQLSDLPKVVYCYQLYTPQHDYQGISDPILYGSSVSEMFPTLMHPNEILDGAVVNAHTVRALETYTIQNHPIIKGLYRRHEKELIFSGMIVGVASMEPIQRERMAIMTANLASNIVGADGAIISKVHGGMARVDRALVAEACEKYGVKTSLIVNLGHSGISSGEQALFSAEALDAVVNVGQTLEKIRLQKAASIFGGTPESKIYNPDFSQKAGDDTIEIEGFLLAGHHSYLGDSRIMAVDY